MTTPQEKKKYILNNIDKYVVDGRRNFYWEDAEEGMSYIYGEELGLRDATEISFKMGERIYQNKEDWGLDFLQDDIHNPILLYKNKKDGRIMYALHVYGTSKTGQIGRSINDYKGTDEKILRLLKNLGIINEEQKKILEEKEKELQNFIEEAERFNQETLKNIREQERKIREQERKMKKWKEERQKEQEEFEKKQQQIRVQKPIADPINNKEPNHNHQLDNSNQAPTNQEKNDSSTQQQPPINIDTQPIEQAKGIQEVFTISETQILQTLKKHNLKITDLPKKYHNWKEQLSKLTTKEKINSLVSEINQQIKNELKAKKKRENNKQHSPQPLSLTAKLLISGGVVTILIVFAFVISKKVKKRKK